MYLAAPREMTDQLWVSAEVKRGSVVLVSPTVLVATVEDTFGSLLDNTTVGQYLKINSKIMKFIILIMIFITL